jgi:hypothetical protein
MGTIGFGIVSEYSRIRNPWPPQKRTTFITTPPFANPLSARKLLLQISCGC